MVFFCCGSRSWRALMIRNLIYRKRKWFGTLLEIALPVGFVGMLLALKETATSQEDFFLMVGSFGPFLVVLGMLYPAAVMIAYVTREKELRQKELMKMMSVTETDIGWSWFFTFVSLHFFSAIFCTLLSIYTYPKSEGIYLFMYWFLTYWSVVNFCSAISSLTSKTTLAVLIGLLLFFFGIFPANAYDYQLGELGITALISLHPIAAFGFGMQEIGYLEANGVGVTSDTWDKSDHESGYSFKSTLSSLVACVILWGVLSWYLNRIVRPAYGQALPLYFPFTISYWFPGSAVALTRVCTEEVTYDADVPFEPVGDNLKGQAEAGESIEIRNLRKTFGDKNAVDSLSLSIYKGQVTALLGHNGAGKTTVINILTGALSPTSGTAIVAGKDVNKQLHQIRQNIGICLQHDCHFPLLTVREHLQFFSRVKGLYGNKTNVEAEELVDQALRDVALTEKRDTLSKNLSGGMKRKLSVAVAFCGGSSVVLLDEPTSGMDPFSRRVTWNIIRQYRQNRIIILTTHFMDEADILGDRIAIMAEGGLRCCGSSLFLKKTYGVGYQLTVEIVPGAIHSDALEEIVTGNVNKAVLLKKVGTELCFQLPMTSSGNFLAMFGALDKKVDDGAIASYGVSMTTLEEVFLSVARGHAASRILPEAPSETPRDQPDFERFGMDLSKEGLFFVHLGALLKKRASYFRRDRRAWCCTTLIPILFVLVGLVVVYKQSQSYSSSDSGYDSAAGFTLWLVLGLSFPFIGGTFGSYVVSERESKAKHMQTVAGVKPSAYWLSTFLWDTLNYQIPCWIVIALIYAFDVDLFTTTQGNVASGVIALLFLYGPAVASFSYFISFAFTSPSLCNMVIIVSGFVFGLGGAVILVVLEENPKDNVKTIASALTWILRLFPPFNLAYGSFRVADIEYYEEYYGEELNAWSEEILLFEVIFLFAESVIYLLLAIQLDIGSTNPKAVSVWQAFIHSVTCSWMCKRKGQDMTAALLADDDVLSEQDRVLSGEANDDLIVMSQLTKVFENGKIAVNNMSLGIPRGECFGLLGINGAGKTTCMGILTAEFPTSQGDAVLTGYSVTSEPEKTRRRVGYCPQFDALFANLTGREHVELYGAIKGIPRENLNEACESALQKVGLKEDDIDRLAVVYSGGMKRRLSLACAMIGQPQILFLDEATTGVDPVSRREIWQVISDMVGDINTPPEQRTSIILTTHSMEECEALCSRIGIMANGRLRCLGSALHLKNKFGQGYQVELKAKLVERTDEDYARLASALLDFKLGRRVEHAEDEEQQSNPMLVDQTASQKNLDCVMFDLPQVQEALRFVSREHGDSLVGLVSEKDSFGCHIWRNASTGLQPLEELAVFCALELRMRKIDTFIHTVYPESVLRERQDNKTRYEVPSEGIRISHVFQSIESNKAELQLADYGISQTSLEHVFNTHAAEAEKLKLGQNDG